MASISSLDALVDFIAQTVSNRFAATGRSTNGTYLAESIRTEDPEFRFEQVGLAKLGDAVRIAETRGKVHRHADVKHLEISPGPKESTFAINYSTPTFHVLADVWRAFVFFRSEQDRYFFDRLSRKVLKEAECEQLANALPNSRFVEIKPIASATQQAWLREFVESHPSLELESAPLNDQRWWSAVPQWFRHQGFDIEKSWNRFRTHHVVEYLREWAEGHDLEPQTFLSTSLSHDQVDREFSSADENALRRVLTEAVQELPLDSLGDIAIPVRLIRRYFRAR